MKLLVRRLPWIAATAFAASCLVWLWRDSRVPHEAFEDYSVFNASTKGLSLAFRYLEAGGRTVRPLDRSLDRAGLPSEAVVFRIRPEEGGGDPGQGSRKGNTLHSSREPAAAPSVLYPFTPEEDDWIRGGGKLVLAIDRAYRGIETDSSPGGSSRKVFPSFAGVNRLEPSPARGLGGWAIRETIAVFSGDRSPLVSFARRGKGEIVLCSVPEIFQNARIGSADHLALLEDLAGAGREVYFDESVHGLDRKTGTLELLARWGFGPFLLFAAFASGIAFWRRRLRVGPEEDDAKETRIEAVDFVDSLAILYGRMLPRRHLLTLYSQSFKQSVALETGLRGPALDQRVRELLPEPPRRPTRAKDIAAAEFQRDLDSINEAFRRLRDAKHSGAGRKAVTGSRRP